MSIIKQATDQSDQGLLLINRPDQDLEIPAGFLSGDEAMEKSFSVNSMYRSEASGHKKASLTLSSVMVAKSILGVGILGLPYVTRQFGILLTVLLIIIFYFQTQYATLLLLKCKNLSKRSNLSTIGVSVFNTRSIITFINVIIILNNFGLCFAEMIIQGTAAQNLMKEIFPDGGWYTERAFLSSISAVIMLPMMLIQKIEKLKHAGLVALLAMTTFCATIIVSFIGILMKNDLPKEFNLFPTDFNILKAFGAFPTLLLAFNWQFNLFPLYKGMQHPSDSNLMKCSYSGMLIATVFYVFVGIMGFGIYGNDTESNFLKMVTVEKIHQIPYLLLNGTFYLSTVLTTPLVFYGARNNFLQLIKSKKHPKVQVNMESEISVEQHRKQKKQRQLVQKYKYYIVSILLFLVIVIGAITVDSLEVAFNIVGSISSNSIGCVLPSLFYFKLVQQKYKGFERTSWEEFQYQFARIFFFISICLSLTCLTSEFLNILNKE